MEKKEISMAVSLLAAMLPASTWMVFWDTLWLAIEPLLDLTHSGD